MNAAEFNAVQYQQRHPHPEEAAQRLSRRTRVAKRLRTTFVSPSWFETPPAAAPHHEGLRLAEMEGLHD